MGKKGRVINCRSHLNTIRILTQLKNEGGEKKGGERREKKKDEITERERERDGITKKRDEYWKKSRELIIENFRSPPPVNSICTEGKRL